MSSDQDSKDDGPQTFFAFAERSIGKTLADEIRKTSSHPLVDTLLTTAGGLLAVLSEHRQVLSLNAALLGRLGIIDQEKALGLRLGEVVGCVHALDNPDGGCGTGKLCASCGAAVAIVSCLSDETPQERICCIHYLDDGVEMDLYLAVRAHPLELDGKKLVLLYLQDVSEQQKLIQLERVFFHDLNNIILVLGVNAELLNESAPPQLQPLIQDIFDSSKRLEREVALQKMLFTIKTEDVALLIEDTPIPFVFGELQKLCDQHPAGRGKRLAVQCSNDGLSVKTDKSVLLRVLGNMLVNALEATEEGGEVRLECERADAQIAFLLSNPGEIPPEVHGRIFQRNFSTKGGLGRGLGTFSMKLFGEKLLGGKVSFACTEAGWTQFSFSLPA